MTCRLDYSKAGLYAADPARAQPHTDIFKIPFGWKPKLTAEQEASERTMQKAKVSAFQQSQASVRAAKQADRLERQRKLAERQERREASRKLRASVGKAQHEKYHKIALRREAEAANKKSSRLDELRNWAKDQGALGSDRQHLNKQFRTALLRR